MVFQKIQNSLKKLGEKAGFRKPDLNYLDDQDLSRFSEQDIILENENQIQQYLPEVLGQALARTWIDKRFLDAFYQYPIEILERGGGLFARQSFGGVQKGKKSAPQSDCI